MCFDGQSKLLIQYLAIGSFTEDRRGKEGLTTLGFIFLHTSRSPAARG
jgi:hypothetical protein